MDRVSCSVTWINTDWEAQMLYTMSVTGKWIPLSGMMKDCSSTKAQIGEDFVLEFAKSILYWKKWEEHKNLEMEVSWTKLPGEEGYNDGHKAWQDLYGLPEDCKNMTDEQITEAKRGSR
ncbi:hypothetical protein SCP_0410390 [Sparassis crispa]|uniref:Uncharacterized protein n=1 Tax=Sparassis crispa TaxID=139825 RepID=A0A401GKI8_9APHY|nr:hypothetical protein SCP_0410390 [Sparassis crispa]GBE82654.1 hypothetical protein SCP_0410390 [Sparassis crispa]